MPATYYIRRPLGDHTTLHTASVNETIAKPRVAAATNTYTLNFPDVNFRVAWLIR